MKLLICTRCNSVFNLVLGETKTCSCGQCGGRYVDQVRAEWWGDSETAFLLGFANSTLVTALRAQLDQGDSVDTMLYAGKQVAKGREFTAFVIPESAPSVCKLTEQPKD
jgi:predicted  nucleic acid-binding Zn-ribbon protein